MLFNLLDVLSTTSLGTVEACSCEHNQWASKCDPSVLFDFEKEVNRKV